jgi:glycosyltransferase involved in cell wall biosynthesis
MRITFVLPWADLTGGCRVVGIYADRLRRRRHEVVVVSRAKRDPTWVERFRHKYLGKALPVEARKTASHLDGLGLDHRQIREARPITAADVPDADVIVATWWETAEWVWAMPPAKGVKIHFMQDYEVFGGPPERVDATCRLPMPKIVIARWVENLLRDQFGQSVAALIPNSVDMAKFHAPPREKQPTPTVGLAYTTFRNKGTDISLAAYRLAAEKVPGLRLVGFGRTVDEKNLPLPAGAEYHPYAPDDQLPGIYARCDAWLFGTRIEGFGLPLLEAMACRTPVIATPAGAAPELLEHGGGILVPPKDPAAMAEAIVKIAQMPEQAWKIMSDQALATAQRWTWEDATDQFEKVLAKVVHDQQR